MVLPCASVMEIMVLLNDAFTCATPEAMFLRSRRRTRVASLPILDPLAARHDAGRADLGGCGRATRAARVAGTRDYFFLPAIAFAGPLRVRALVSVRWSRT